MIAARVLVTQSLCGPIVERKLLARGIRALCPMYSRSVRHARRTEIKQYPLYSCYMFAWLEDDQMRHALSVSGCVDVLRKAGDRRAMSVVPDAVIDALGCAPMLESFSPGDDVTISHGRWENYNGVYSHSEDERVILLFRMLGQDIPMPFHRSEVRKTLHQEKALVV